ncbi:DMT family transporter [Marivita hallyeonensis]|uniref:Permease of the drug/metabolite transporter (DMT) superfamily n=1 Tax=Marivita hallyeonensis TaxID=996342 RepID=A0A1M5W5L7_9RHOB|nr:DMT family transporter [Marivita hallyeonensis]SHH82786.1 Permease of the drug/metabolite transporter (DMT) superfamily [Marivita hallyeonensis]
MSRLLPLVVLILAGAAWGATQPLSKVAVSEGYRPLGILFWQLSIGVLALGAVTLMRGKRLRFEPRDMRLYVLIALIGTLFPGIASYSAAVHLPSGVLSILLSSIPMFAFPIALVMGLDSFSWRRLTGLSLGFIGISLLVVPEASLPETVVTIWIFVALFSSLCYALEGNVVAKLGRNGLDPVQVLCGASLVGAVMALPLALVSGQWIAPHVAWGAPDTAILASSLLHAAAYSSYVWLVGRAGPVFTAQISYLVTLFGVTWAMLFLGENYSRFFWAALAIMLTGLALVQPRPKAALVPSSEQRHIEST